MNTDQQKAKLEGKIERIEESLRQDIEGLQRQLANTLERLDNGEHVDGYGPVRGRGSDIDRLCGEREQLNAVLYGL